MRRITMILGAMAMAVAACGGTSPTATPVVVTPTPATATSAPATPTPAPTPVPVAVTVTFDGKACKYAGPKVIPQNAAVTFTMTNLPAALQGSVGAALLVMPVRQGTTWEQIVADVAASKSIADEPAWVFLDKIGDQAIQVLYPDATSRTLLVIPTFQLDYFVMCATAPDETDKGFPAILLNILPG